MRGSAKSPNREENQNLLAGFQVYKVIYCVRRIPQLAPRILRRTLYRQDVGAMVGKTNLDVRFDGLGSANSGLSNPQLIQQDVYASARGSPGYSLASASSREIRLLSVLMQRLDPPSTCLFFTAWRGGTGNQLYGLVMSGFSFGAFASSWIRSDRLDFQKCGNFTG